MKVYDKEHSRNYTVYAPDILCKCKVCGDTFLARTASAQICSGRCRNDIYIARRRARLAAKRQKSCAVCGIAFASGRSDGKFCSSKCKQADYRKNVTVNSLAELSKTGSSNSLEKNKGTAVLETSGVILCNVMNNKANTRPMPAGVLSNLPALMELQKGKLNE